VPRATSTRFAGFDAFAHCLAGLHWAASARNDPLGDVVALTYPPGFAIEARFDARQLLWIGFVSHRDVVGVAASVTPAVFDELRTSGDRDGPLDPHVAKTLELDQGAAKQAYAWVLACIDEHGVPTGFYWRELTSARAAHAFADAATRGRRVPALGRSASHCRYQTDRARTTWCAWTRRSSFVSIPRATLRP
jgi:hypothetical protein